jgi:hypothetical protein
VAIVLILSLVISCSGNQESLSFLEFINASINNVDSLFLFEHDTKILLFHENILLKVLILSSIVALVEKRGPSLIQ